jgi:hypothetical protein
MSSEIIQNVAYDNYDDFQHFNFLFSQNFISLFWGLFNDQTDLRGKVLQHKHLTSSKIISIWKPTERILFLIL